MVDILRWRTGFWRLILCDCVLWKRSFYWRHIVFVTFVASDFTLVDVVIDGWKTECL